MPLTRTTRVGAVHSWPVSASTTFWRVASFFSERRDGVLEVDEHHVGRQRRRLGDHLGIGAGDGEAGSA